MIQNPRLKNNYCAKFPDDEIVLLISEKDQVLLTDKMQNLILSEILQNDVSIDDLIENLAGRASSLEVYRAIAILEKKGYIAEASPGVPPEENAFWNGMGIDPNALCEVLKNKRVDLTTIGPVSPDTFFRAFEEIGIQTGKNADIAGIKIILTDDYKRHDFKEINKKALASGQPWMLAKPVGVEIWIGPLFLPNETGCWECLKQRLDINSPLNDFYQAKKGVTKNLHVPIACLPASSRIAADKIAMEMVKWLFFGKNESLESTIVTYDMKSFQASSHTLVKRPQCKACGDPEQEKELVPIVLEKKQKMCRISMGGYREVRFEDTLEKYRHHVSPVTGVMPILRPYHPADGAPIYNYSSGRNIAMRSKTLFWLNQHVRSGNGGKGRTRTQAKVGALCESIERYSLTYHGNESHIQTSFRELGDDGIHPNSCMRYSEKQYKNRDAINRTYTKFYDLIPVPFDESLTMHWTPVYSLTKKKFKYLPSCFCYAQYPAEDDFHLFSYPDCNGAAAGNSPEEAILQGFLELVERDSVALWWYNMLCKPAVDLQSFDDPYFMQLIEYYKSLNRSLYVLDLTTDLNIPAFGAVSHRTDGGSQDIVFGFGAHVDAKIGVERALIELNQILPIANVPEKDRSKGIYRTPDRDFLQWLKTATMENQPYLCPMDNRLLKTALDYPRLCEQNILDSILFCLDATDKQGVETLVLDMTRPDIKLPVFRVFAPGLRHFWKRLDYGRLYDIPVKMGWLDKARKEEKMNPIALFI